MKKSNKVNVNGVSKSRAQWARSIGVTKAAISLREKNGESARRAIGEIIYTKHSESMLRHYRHARSKHPHFCDKLTDYGKLEWAELEKSCRTLIGIRAAAGELSAADILDCEIAEAFNAIANGDIKHAIEECYDAAVVLLRIVDVLKGAQVVGYRNPLSESQDGCREGGSYEKRKSK